MEDVIMIVEELNTTIGVLSAGLEKVAEDQASFSGNADGIWMIICGALVFFMHAGFAMLEAGAVQSKNTVNILFKNIMTVSIGAVGYLLLGYSWAYGGDIENGFIGAGGYLLAGVESGDYAFWYFQMVFAATCATIVSGAVAERTKLEAYFIITLYLVMFTYPVVSHWIWSDYGFLSAFQAVESTLFYGDETSHGCGMIDFAGSGVVHLVGGTTGFVGAKIVGPRTGRFEVLPTGKLGKVLPLPASNLALCAIGTFILWFGWYGFNCGSTLAFDAESAALVAINTSISPAMACITGVAITFAMTKTFDLGVALNCTLGGLVGITAGCSVVAPWMSLFVGAIAAPIYIFGSWLMKKLKIDDPLDAVAVHGFCGIWGVLVPGIFGTVENVTASYSSCPAEGFNQGIQFVTQVVGFLSVIAWTVGTTLPLFLVLKYTMGLRVSEHAEQVGLDESEHGAKAYELAFPASEESDAPLLRGSEASASENKGEIEAVAAPLEN